MTKYAFQSKAFKYIDLIEKAEPDRLSGMMHLRYGHLLTMLHDLLENGEDWSDYKIGLYIGTVETSLYIRCLIHEPDLRSNL